MYVLYIDLCCLLCPLFNTVLFFVIENGTVIFYLQQFPMWQSFFRFLEVTKHANPLIILD